MTSDKHFAWLEISNNLNNERSWIGKYVELNQRKRRLRLYPNECIRSNSNDKHSSPLYNLNNEMISSLSSSSSSLHKSTNVSIRSNCMLQSLSEYISPSLSKTIYSSSIIPNEKSIESNRILSIDSLSDRPSSLTTTTTTSTTTTPINRQSKTKFSQFFSRSSFTNHSLKRTKSATKLERQRRQQQISTNNNNNNNNNQSSLLNIPSNRSRSHESLLISRGPGNGPLGSISSAKPAEIFLDNCHIRRLHPSILQSNDQHLSYHYVQITNNQQNKNLFLRSKQCFNENNLLLNRLRSTCLDKSSDGLRMDNSLDIWILEAKGLPNKKKYYVKIFVDDDIFGKTTSKERREILFWGENFLFKDLPEGCSNVRCKIYRENEKRKQKNGFDVDLIGLVDIPLSTIKGNQYIEQWYPLQISNGKDKSQKIPDGSISIRIKSKYQTIEILPIESYLHLQEYIRRNYLQLIEILEPQISLRDKDEIATSLTRISQCLSFSTAFLVDIIQAEILSTADNTLTFRGNSIATKSMEAYMKLIGETYLHETLTRFLSEIVSIKNLNEIDFEVDPDRVINIQHLERNQITLRLLCEQIWSHIQQSYHLFPLELKRIFFKLRQLSSSDETMFNLISGSVFLRFLCPAILSPNLFGLTQEYPTEKASRKLTLIAKTLQTLANFSKFGSKESYMKFMNDFVTKESDNMRRFLANISTIDRDSIENESIDDNLRSEIDLGREYSILHSTLVDVFEQLDSNIRQNLSELEYILFDLSNTKSIYFSQKSSHSQIHFHHHHHHVYHHPNSSSPYDSQISLSLNGTATTNASSQGYHSISTSSTNTNIETINKDNSHSPLAFTNPIYNEKQMNQCDLSENENEDDSSQMNSSKTIAFINNLCLQTLNDSPRQEHLIHSPSEQSLSQKPSPLFILNNSYLRRSAQNLTSNNLDVPRSSYIPPKMGVKALNHTSINKDLLSSQRSPLLNLYQEEKCRRIQSEKQTERLREELYETNEQLKEYRQLIEENTIFNRSFYSFDDDSKPIEDILDTDYQSQNENQ